MIRFFKASQAMRASAIREMMGLAMQYLPTHSRVEIEATVCGLEDCLEEDMRAEKSASGTGE